MDTEKYICELENSSKDINPIEQLRKMEKY